MRGHPLDVDALHAALFRRADRLGRLRISQRQFAEELGVAHETICRIMAKMAKAGRIRRIKSEKNNIGVYAVVDPTEWREANSRRETALLDRVE